MEKLKAAFIKFRGGSSFLATLILFLCIWFVLRSLFHFDPEYGLLNMILSIEASLATCFLLDQTQRQYERDHQILTEAAEAVDEIHDTVEEIQKELE